MESKKITQLATKVTPANTDLITIGDPTTGELKKATLLQIAGIFGGAGSVSSVSMTVPTGLSITGSPITTSGTLAVTLTAGYSIPTTSSQTTWDTAYADRNKWDGGSSALVAATGRTSLGGTTIGSNIFTLTNPSAITFLRVNADNSISALDAATFRTAIGAGTSSAVGTVISVAALTLGSSGVDVSSTVATGTTTPVITLNIPTASSTARGALSSADWTTFNGKQNALVAASSIVDGYLTSANFNIFNGKQDVLVKADATHNGYLDKTDYISFAAKQNALGTGTAGQFLSYNQTWQTPVLTTALASLTDVTITSPTNGQLLRYTVGGWVNFTPTYVAAGFFTATSPLTYNSTTGVFGISAATSSVDGYLTSANFTIFNSKQAAINGTGFVKASGTTISYDNSTYLTTSSAASTYLPLVGGTLTGALSGTSAIFSSTATATDFRYSTNGYLTYDTAATGTNTMQIRSGYAGAVLSFTGTGAATFSSSIQATTLALGSVGAFTNGIYLNNSTANAANYGYIKTNASSINTTQLILGTTYGYSTPVDALTLFNGTATFASTVTATSFYESSDKRVKTLIEDNYQTKGIETISPKLYTKNDKVELGYYAQDVQGILDSAISEGEDGMLSLSYREVHTAKIYALELEIKELKELIKSMIDGNRN